MIVEAIQNLTLILAKSSPYATINAEQRASDQLRLVPGQQVQAEVLASLPNQRFLARIAGELFHIELPMLVQPGETLQLTLVTGGPHPVFSLSRSGNSATPVTISDTGKWLAELCSTPADRQQVASLLGSATLFSGPHPDTLLLAGLLRDAMTLNGLFYEAHLLQWFLGRRALRDILKEPQGRLSARAKSARAGKRRHVRTQADDKGAALEQGEELGEEFPLGAAGERPSVGVDPGTIPLIREQLRSLDSGRIVWQGEVWPRQEMEWSIGEEKRERGNKAKRSWQSSLRLDLPTLGGVAATLRLDREGLSLSIRTEMEGTSGLMREERESLVTAMTGCGVKLLNLTIEHGNEGKGT